MTRDLEREAEARELGEKASRVLEPELVVR
jgi:hypothetical protein